MKGFHKATATTGYLNCPSEAVEPSEAVKLTFGHWLGNVLEHPALFAAFGWYTIGSLGSLEINAARDLVHPFTSVAPFCASANSNLWMPTAFLRKARVRKTRAQHPHYLKRGDLKM